MTLWAVKTSKLAAYLGQEDKDMGSRLLPPPFLLQDSLCAALATRPGQGCGGVRQAGGPGRAEGSNQKEHTGAERTEKRWGWWEPLRPFSNQQNGFIQEEQSS